MTNIFWPLAAFVGFIIALAIYVYWSEIKDSKGDHHDDPEDP